MPILSDYSRRRKQRYFLDAIAPEWRVLEVGCGSGWAGAYLRARGVRHVVGIDLQPPAEIVGDVRDWQALGLAAGSFDVIVAFEVVEHADCWEALDTLLRPGGLLMATSPHPNWDWACRACEALGLAQRRTSPHSHLIDFHRVPYFEPVAIRRVGILAQWGIFRKPAGERAA